MVTLSSLCVLMRAECTSGAFVSKVLNCKDFKGALHIAIISGG